MHCHDWQRLPVRAPSRGLVGYRVQLAFGRCSPAIEISVTKRRDMMACMRHPRTAVKVITYGWSAMGGAGDGRNKVSEMGTLCKGESGTTSETKSRGIAYSGES